VLKVGGGEPDTGLIGREMVRQFVILFHNAEDNLFVSRYAIRDQEESGASVVLHKHIQDLGSRDRIWDFGRSLRECRDDPIRLQHC
jgi:hypothetical protein